MRLTTLYLDALQLLLLLYSLCISIDVLAIIVQVVEGGDILLIVTVVVVVVVVVVVAVVSDNTVTPVNRCINTGLL